MHDFKEGDIVNYIVPGKAAVLCKIIKIDPNNSHSKVRPFLMESLVKVDRFVKPWHWGNPEHCHFLTVEDGEITRA